MMTVFAASALVLSAAPRVALVRVKEIYSELPTTAALQERIKQERQEIMKDPRAEDLRRVLSELQELQAKLSDKNNPLDEEAGRKIARTYEIKRQEAQTMQREFESFRSEREKEINRRMVAGMRELLNRITDTSRKVAGERGYDLVFDSSGNTNTGVPFILYQKQSPDLTEDVKAALKDAAAAAQAPAPAADAKPVNPNR
jgi:Skp family chaperone for outer membrane proteins